MQARRSRWRSVVVLAALAPLPVRGEEKTATSPAVEAAPDSAPRLAEQAVAARRIAAEAKPPAPRAADRVMLADVVVIRGKMIVVKQKGGDVPLVLLFEVPDANQAGQPAPQVRVSPETFDRWFFGASRTAAACRTDLNAVLQSKIGRANQASLLTPEQKQKLALAGEGDIRRLFERLDEAREEFDKVAQDQEKVVALLRKGSDLRDALQSGPFGEGSLFVKLLKRVLTADQWAAYEAAKPVRTPAEIYKASPGAP